MPSLAYREAYTTYAAQEVVVCMAQGFGLTLDREANPNHAATACHPGRVVYVYRASAAAKTEVLGHRDGVWAQWHLAIDAAPVGMAIGGRSQDGFHFLHFSLDKRPRIC